MMQKPTLLPRVKTVWLTLMFVILALIIQTSTSTTTDECFSDRYVIERFEPITIFHDAYASDHLYVRSMAECALVCSRNPVCEAFFVADEELQPNDELLPNCTILSLWQGDAHFSVIKGKSGVLKNSSVKANLFGAPPNLYRGVLTGIVKIPAGIAAIYDLSSAHPKMTTLGILYLESTNEWPVISPACLAQVAYQTGLSGTYLDFSTASSDKGDDTILARVVCQEYDDTHHTDAVCHSPTGIWSYVGGHLDVGCFSETCYRYDGSSRARYKGRLRETLNGIECQAWNSQEPTPHIMVSEDFSLDNFDINQAENFCRDPDGESTPWCYQMSGKRWEFCHVPICSV